MWGTRRLVERSQQRRLMTLALGLLVVLSVTFPMTAAAAVDDVAIYQLDEGAGGVATDTSGNGNDGILVGDAAYSVDTADGSPFSVEFDGSGDRIDAGPLDVAGSGVSLAAWFNADQFPGSSRDPRIVSKASGTAPGNHVFMLSTAAVGAETRLRARVRVGGTTTTLIADSGDLAIGTWYHAAMTYDGTTLRLYLNAVEVGSRSVGGPVDTDPAMSVAIGGQPQGAGNRFFDGKIDSVRILQRALTAEEVAALVSGGAGQAPSAVDDAYAATEDTTLSVGPLAGVLANDSDPDGDPLTAVLSADVSDGTLTLNPDGSFDYTPDPNFFGTDTFTYVAFDGTLSSSPATVQIDVAGTPDAPVAQDDAYQTPPDTMLNVPAPGVLGNDVDPDTDPLSAVLVQDVGNGALTLNADGSFTYQPNAGFVGDDVFTYEADDGGAASNQATVTISVVDNPADPDAVVQLGLDEGSGSVALDASGNGNDGVLLGSPVYEANTADGSPYSLRFDGVDDLIDLGVIDVVGSGLTLAGWFNADSFPGRSRDPRLISKATSVARNDHVFMLSTAAAGAQTRLRGRVRVGGSTKTLVAPSGNLSVGTWYHAALTYDGTTLRLYLDGVEVGSSGMSGPVDQDPTAAVAVGGQPPGAGDRSFDGLLDDIRILSRALTPSEVAELAMTGGGPGNAPPVAQDDSYAVGEDSTLVVDPTGGVLANDSDPDLDTLTAVLASDATQGSLSLNADGSFDYTPNSDFFGTDTFTYTASDGSLLSSPATVTIDVTPAPDPPVARNDSLARPADTDSIITVATDLLGNDSDPDGDAVFFDGFTQPTQGALADNGDGTLTYSPPPGFTGTDTFSYTINDGTLVSPPATVSISVGTMNQPPRIVSGSLAFDKTVIDNTVDNAHEAVAGDFDGDGDLDAVATDYVDGIVSWYENLGGGAFTRRVLDPSLAGAYPASVGDVDSDGDVDVLAGGYLANTFKWYENDGGATFTAHVIDAAAAGAHSIVTVDLDADGDNDLLVTTQDNDRVSWYRNDGAENFTLFVIDAAANKAKRAEAADLDGDGDLDVVSASFGSNEVAWYENDGNEVFTEALIDGAANGAYFVYPADLDGDLDVDVLAANRLDDTIAWYENDGNGNFSKRIIDSTAVQARTVRAVDVDADGDLDALAASVDDDTVALHLNDGAGVFSLLVVDAASDGAYSASGADMDNDGDVDILVASRDANDVALHTQTAAHVASLDVGGTLVIDDQRLKTVDSDDGPAELTYTLTAAPGAGTVRLGATPLGVGGTFTQADVDAGNVSYQHDGSPAALDGFDFSVADGGEGGFVPAAGTFTLSIVDPFDVVVHLPLDEGSGTTAGDISGNGNDGTLVNGALFEAASADGSPSSVRFDGVNDRIDLGSIDVIGSGLTLAAWIKADSFPGGSSDPRIFSKATSIKTNNHIFMLSSFAQGGEVRLRGRIRVAGSTSTLVASAGALSTGVWHHVALTYDGSTLLLYVDGVQVGSRNLTGAVDADPSVPVAIGNQPAGAGSRSFDGLIDDVRILRRALSAAEIFDLANS